MVAEPECKSTMLLEKRSIDLYFDARIHILVQGPELIIDWQQTGQACHWSE